MGGLQGHAKVKNVVSKKNGRFVSKAPYTRIRQKANDIEVQ